MSVKYSAWGNTQFFDINGDPAVGWKIYSYAAGSSTLQSTYTTAAGTVAQSNPIIIDTLGTPTMGQIWLTAGLTYKFVLTDANDVVKDTQDNISGVNDAGNTTSQWQTSGVTPTYISASSFSLSGDQTTEFHVGRQSQFTTTAGTVYGAIATTAYTTLTTVTMTMVGAQVLDAGLSAVNLSILRADNPSLPNSAAARAAMAVLGTAGGAMTGQLKFSKGANIASASTVDLSAATGNTPTITGVATINGWTLTSGQRMTVVFAGACPLTYNATTNKINGGTTLTTAAGDFAEIFYDGTTTYVNVTRASGTAVMASASELYVLIRDEKPSATDGGDFNSGAWRTRTLNTEVNDAGNLATLTANVVALLAGTYRFRLIAPGYSVGSHQARLQNTSDAISYYGTVETAPSTVQTSSEVTGRFTVAATKNFELQHQCSTTKTGNGFGSFNSFGNIQVYAQVEFWKEF